MRVAIVGGTGGEGFGLAVRLAAAGLDVTIGSRAQDRADGAAQRAREFAGQGAVVDGAENPKAVAGAELVFVTVPYEGQAATYRALKEHWPDHVVVCDTTTPLATAVGGRATQVIRPWHGSAAEQARAHMPERARLVAGFHSVGAETLTNHPHPVVGDALLCGDDHQAKASVGELVERIPGLRWVDCGPLSMARILEPMTAMLVSINRRYGMKDAGIQVTGREQWGRPS